MANFKLLQTTIQRLAFALLFCATALSAHAQGTVSGKIKDRNDNSLVGVTILIKGTSRGTITGADGSYKLSVPQGKQVLVASFIGFSTNTVEVTIESGQTYTQNFTMEKDNLSLDEVVVTATFASRSQKEAPLSMTYLNSNQIQRLTSNSQADILRSIPGITAEGGGGEVASNIFVRGMPSGGQYQFTPLQVDGLPVLSTFGLNSSAHDVYFRNDIGIRSLEFARGGASTLFGAGSVAGIINYASITGGPVSDNKVQLELAQGGRAKVDFLSSGALAENLYYAISGFYRYDEGPLETGLPTRGYQIRANIKRIFNEGKSSFTVYGQAIDDNVQFYLPYPLANQNGEKARPIGNDGEEIFTMLTSEATSFSFDTPNGVYESRIADGVITQGNYVMADLKHNFGDNWKISSKVKAAKYDHWFNLFLDGDGIHNTPEAQDTYLEDRALPADASFTYVDNGEGLAGSDLLFENRILDRQRPMEEMAGELNLTKSVNGHNFTLGTFLSDTRAEDNNWLYRYLGDFSNAPRMVALSYMDTTGQMVNYSTGGFISGNQTSNTTIESVKRAFYFADEYQGEKFNFDIGVRVEQATGFITKESGVGSNNFLKGRVDATGFAIAGAGLYKLNRNTSIYANASRGYFFPELRGVKFSSPGVPQSYEPEEVIQAEIGGKYSSGSLAATGAVYLVALNDRRSVDFVNLPSGGVTEEVSVQSTRTIGVEVNVNYQLVPGVNLYGNATYQDAQFTKFEGNNELVGKTPRRQPAFISTLGVSVEKGGFDLDLSNNFLGSKFANDANTVELDAYSILRANVGYRISLGEGDESVRIGLSGFNLLNSDGVTEGSPRQGNSQISGGEFFVGRPILPRRIFIRILFDF
ncbi:MAG: TonB-dependent receptor [Bacteroidia bacterium]|nr:TonB-dependent receptor [Bacteroidia bacterium]